MTCICPTLCLTSVASFNQMTNCGLILIAIDQLPIYKQFQRKGTTIIHVYYDRRPNLD